MWKKIYFLLLGTLLFAFVVYRFIEKRYDFDYIDLTLFIISQYLIFLYFKPNKIIYKETIKITLNEFEIPDMEQLKRRLRDKHDYFMSFNLENIDFVNVEADIYLNDEKFHIVTLKTKIDSDLMVEAQNNAIEENEITDAIKEHKYHILLTIVPSKGKKEVQSALLLEITACLLEHLNSATGVYFSTLNQKEQIIHKIYSKDYFIAHVDNHQYKDLLN